MQGTRGALAPFGQRPDAPAAAADTLESASANLRQDAKSPNTRRAYESDWASWEAFCRAHDFVPLPADPEHVKLYLTQLTDFFGAKGKKFRPRTAERHLSAITTTHCAEGLAFDRNYPAPIETLDGIRRKFSVAQKGALALRTKDVIALCKTLGRDIGSLRDKAIILLGFAGGFRRSEIVALNAEDLEFKDGTLRVTLRRSKTDQVGKGRAIVVCRDRISKLVRSRRCGPIESVATILARETNSTIDAWLARVDREGDVLSIRMGHAERSAYFPQLFLDLISRLQKPLPLGTRALASPSASKHGRLRREQGYTPAMMVEESRMLQVSIFQTLEHNLTSVDFNRLLGDVMAIADEVDSQLAQQMASYIAESKKDDKEIAP